ncbi:MAG: glycoside hydrolase family 57 protein [Verrucomicrobia bacterium]|nr:glycoside hydrolase family 57 protein [Verrucomicrobiota bacterium]
MADLAILWHFHQPSYLDAATGEVMMPWVRLHTVGGYSDMAEMARRHPGVKLNFNLTPVLVQQIEQLAEGKVRDRWGELAKKDAKELTEIDRRDLLEHFFKINWATSVNPYPRYRALLDLRGRRVGAAQSPQNVKRFKEGDLRDLQVWFNLSWCGFAVRQRYPELGEMIRKGRDFTEEEKQRVLAIHQEVIQGILGEYRALADSGQVELTTTPFYHPILPLLVDTDVAKRAMPGVRLPDRLQAPEDALAQLRRAQESHTRVFGRKARGLWPSEGSVSPEIIPLMAQAGFEYFCTDEWVLFRGLEAQGRKTDHLELFQAWRVEEGGATVKALFRERPLSDYIGFTAARTEPKAAANYLQTHLEHIAQVMPKDGVVLLALDGENAWEAFPDNGEAFLEAFYAGLEKAPGLRAQTLGEYLDRVEGKPTGRLHSGSWISANFDIWIGDPEENLGWNWIKRTRDFLKQAEAKGTLSAKTLAAAWEDVYAAEGSDWFWWYGPDFQTDSDLIFDALFRGRLQNVYRRLGVTPPPALSVPICAAELRLGRPPVRMIEPKLGPSPSFLDWAGAGRYEAWRDQGAMAQGDRRVRAIQYGFGQEDFFIRLDAKGMPGDEVVVDFNRPATIRLRAMTTPEGWQTLVERAEDGVTYVPVKCEPEAVNGQGLQLRVPFCALGWAQDGKEISFLVRVIRAGVEAERYPERGLIEFTGPARAVDLKNWYI